MQTTNVIVPQNGTSTDKKPTPLTLPELDAWATVQSWFNEAQGVIAKAKQSNNPDDIRLALAGLNGWFILRFNDWDSVELLFDAGCE